MSNNKIEISVKDIPIVVEQLEKANAEIERLKRRLEEYQEYVEINHKEIERLNNIINGKNKEIEDYSNKWCELAKAKTKSDNIINELEKGIKENIEELEEHQLSRDRIDEDKEILRFLQELKGDDKNDKS